MVKHADVRALEAVSDLIENLRRRSDLVEKRLGIFYTKGRAFLHFHKDPTGLFADLREGSRLQPSSNISTTRKRPPRPVRLMER